MPAAKKKEAPSHPEAEDGLTVMVAKSTYWTELDGVPVRVDKGRTRARASHPIVTNNPENWEPAFKDLEYDVEDASAQPGMRRGESVDESTRVVTDTPKQAGRVRT